MSGASAAASVLAEPGEQVLLPPQGQVALRAAFVRWFGNSKVVDATGQPLVVYRGDRPNKTQFTGREDSSNLIQGNVFFSDKPAIGKFYTAHRTAYMVSPDSLSEADGLYRVYLSLQNPLIVDAQGADWSDIPNPLRRRRVQGAWGDTIQIDDLAAAANKLGFDGLIVRNVWDQAGSGNQFVAFRPEQIKSANRNGGQYDPHNPDIRASKGPRPLTASTNVLKEARIHSASQPDLTAGEHFKRWFAGSKVVDAQGQPLVVYHGTNAGFDVYRPSLSGAFGPGIYFADSPDEANLMAGRTGVEGRNLMPVYVSITNPYVWGPDDGMRAADIVNAEARAAGHDGIIREWADGSREIVAFRPEQVKSAIGNSGQFDPDNPDIRYSEGAETCATFDRWFDGSTVVDLDGKPLVVYHGSSEEFSEFDPGRISGRSYNEFGAGFYFTPKAETASLFGRHVMPVHLALKNPKYVSTLDRFGCNGWHGEHDGLIVVHSGGDRRNPADWAEIVVARPDQIKPAPVAPRQESTPAFRRWFGDSKVVDERGRPLVGVHYTNALFDAFDHEARAAAAWKEEGFTTSYGRGFVFPNKGFFVFAGKVPPRTSERIGMPVYVRIVNPLDFRTGLNAEEAGKLIDFLKSKVNADPRPGMAGFKLRGEAVGGLRRARKEGLTGRQVWDLVNTATYDRRGLVYDEILDHLGKDGVIFPSNSAGTYLGEAFRGRGDGLEYLTVVARQPEQLKSAIGNCGAFDAGNPDIRCREVAEEATQKGAAASSAEAFKAWFKNSKVVDERGHPRVVYHGTTADFAEFNVAKGEIGAHFGTATQASRRTEDLGGTERGQNLMPVYLSLQNPLRMPDMGSWDACEVLEEARALGAIAPDQEQSIRAAIDEGRYTDAMLRDALLVNGYDGIVYANVGEEVLDLGEEAGDDSYIAFRPEQIKSATGNAGTFDGNNADIRFRVQSRGELAARVRERHR